MKKITISAVSLVTLISIMTGCLQAPTSNTPPAPGTSLANAPSQTVPVSPIPTSIEAPACAGEENDKPIHDAYYENGQIARIGNGRSFGIDWSSDGSKIAVGSETGIYIFDAISLKKIQFINTGHGVETVRFSPDRKYVASAHHGRVGLWDLTTGKLFGEIGNDVDFYSARWVSPPRPELGNISFSPDGKLVVVHAMNYSGLDADPDVQIWDVTTLSLVREWKSDGLDYKGYIGPNPVFSPDGKYIASPWKDQIIVWNVDSGEVVKKIQDGQNFSLFSVDGEKVLTTKNPGTLELVDWQTEKSILIEPTNEAGPYSLIGSFTPDGKNIILYNSSHDETFIELRDVQSGKFIRSLPLATYVFAFAVNPTGNELVTLDYEQNIHIWDLDQGILIRSHKFSDFVGSEVYPSPDGSFLIVQDDDHFHLYNSQTGQHLCTYEQPVKEPYFFSFRPDGKEFAAITPEGDAVIWDLKSGNATQIIENGKVYPSTNSGSLTYWATDISNKYYDLLIWGWREQGSGNISWIATSCDAHQSVPTTCPGTVSYDGKLIASIDQKQGVFIVQDVESYEIISQINDIGGSNNYSFSPDGKYLLSLRFLDWGIDIWNIQTQENVTKINGGMEGEGPILGLQEFSFTSDGTELVTYLPYFQKESVRLWDTSTWEMKQSFDTLGGVGDAKISGDGSLIAALSGYVVYLWHLN